MQMKITLLGWYNYDENIFSDMVLPSSLDRDVTINTILMRCGEFNVIYSNLDFLRFAIKNWSERHLKQFEKMAEALQDNYNPLHNYDRYEEYEDLRNTENSANSENSLENTISADNANTYQPDNKSAGEMTNASTGKETITHNAHLYGNIGVTTSQQMLESEIELRKHFGIYDVVAASFMEEFTMPIYG